MLDWIEKASEEEKEMRDTLSFEDYIQELEKHPDRELRTSFTYLIDMLNFHGKNEDGSYSLFDQDHNESPAVYGQKKVQDTLVHYIKNFKEEGFNNKFILLVGPNGSSKSSIVRKLMKGMEIYSHSEKGALYTFSWIFPIDNFVKGSLGLNSEKIGSDLNSFAYLEDKDISAILNSELKDHPLLLIPREHRRTIIDDMLKDSPERLETIQRTYLYNGNLSKRNKMIYDALLKNYKGRHREVLKHIRVERFDVSKRYSSAAVTIEPQLHVDAQMQQITMDKRLGSLPPSLQSLNLFSLKGEVVLANRGVLEYSDLLKRPLDSYKYLLMTMETKNVNLQGILTELDIFFVGTSNEIHLAAFKQHPDFNSFKGRFNFIRVPYLLDYKKEEKIYENQVDGLKDMAYFEPYALRAICLFSIMTRLRCPQVKNYQDKKLANIATNLNPLEKVLFLANDGAPDRLDYESKQILEAHRDEVEGEFEFENLYEGKFGISPRDIKGIIYRLSNRSSNISFIDVIEKLQKLITKKNDYDFLNMTPQADYHHPARFITLVKEYCYNLFDRELRDCLGMIDDRSYEDYIRRYIENVIAHTKGEKVRNTITAKYEDVDVYIIEEFEKSINLKEDATKFRSALISRLGAYSLDNPGKGLVYTDVFPNLSEKLQESFREEQKKVIQIISRNLVFYEAELVDEDENGATPLSNDNRVLIDKIVDALQNKYGHTKEGAITVMKALIKDRY
jgi:predicted Ser/Thr protein kinase